MTDLALHYGKETIAFKLARAPRPKNNIVIHVHPDGTVQVEAPQNADDKAIVEAVYKRARWIHNNLGKIREQYANVQPRRYVSGESHFYLGRRYMLKVERSKQTPDIKLYRGRLHAIVKRKQRDEIRQLLWHWYRQRAKCVFAQRLQTQAQRIRLLNGKVPALRLMAMKKQWGSCSPKGTIILNTHLIKAPSTCVDYVICHELCHLQEHNHSKRFYTLLGRLMPDWQVVKGRLDGMAELLLNR